jgi:hypothetical protein
MAVRIVDALEVVDIADHQAARELPLQMRRHKHAVNAIEFRPVGHLS